MGNEIEKYKSEVMLLDTLISNKNSQIEILRWRDTVRTNQLAEANFKVMNVEKANKSLKRTILVYKVAAILSILVAVYTII